MYPFISGLIFYSFAALTIFSACIVITAKNPVTSVLFLILTFFTSAGLFILIGAEFIAMILVIVYVGAVAVLFLFVVMMLNIDDIKVENNINKYSFAYIIIALVLIADLTFALNESFKLPIINSFSSHPIDENLTNTHALGSILYTDYVYPFQISGIILLVSMIGSIALTINQLKLSKKQDINQQLVRTRTQSVQLIKVKAREGIDV